MKRIPIRMEDGMHEKLRRESFETGESMNSIILSALEDRFKGETEMNEKLFIEKHGLLLEMIEETGKVRLSNVEDNLEEIIEDLETLGYEVTVSHDFEGYLYATKQF